MTNASVTALERIEKDKFGALTFPDDFTYADYCDTILQASDKEDESKWTAADTFWHVHDMLGEEYAYQLPKPQKLTEQAWENRVSIAKKFPANRRRAYGVSFVSFYEVVRKLPDELIDKLLTLARVNEWTRADLLDAKKAIARDCPKCKAIMVTVNETTWKCLGCGHEMEIVADPPKPVKAQGAVKQTDSGWIIDISGYLPAELEDGIEVSVTVKRLDKAA